MKTCLTHEIRVSIDSASSVPVQEIARESAGYGLAVGLPHLHDGEVMGSPPTDRGQHEGDLRASFPRKEFEQVRQNIFPVMVR